jgi:hypothetical protein
MNLDVYNRARKVRTKLANSEHSGKGEEAKEPKVKTGGGRNTN